MTLSQYQLEKVKKAIGDGSDWPKITNDPMVNHKIDQLVSDPELSNWEDLTSKERRQYRDEVEYLLHNLKIEKD